MPGIVCGALSSSWPGHRAAKQPSGRTGCTEKFITLKSAGVVAFPTETVYGLGADASNAAAVAKLYALKVA